MWCINALGPKPNKTGQASQKYSYRLNTNT